MVEFGHVQVPMELCGRDGTLRGHGVRSIEAEDDIEAMEAWLVRCRNRHTQRAYRRETERLILWATAQRGKPLSSLVTEDYAAYAEFLENPQPAERWCAPQRPRPRRGAMAWRPFAGPMKPKSLAYAMGVVKLLTTYLHASGYLAINPMATYRIKHPEARAVTDRYLERDLVLAGFDAVERLPRDNEEQVHNYERARFLLRLLYGCGPRPHEVVQATMMDLRERDGRWWWYITGKGAKERKVVLAPGLVESLRRYRRSRRLPPLPMGNETAPLIAALRGGRGLRGPDALRRMVREIFTEVEAALPKNDPRRDLVARASTHWLRHTFATHQLDDGAKIKHVQRQLGHADVRTLSIYTHAEEREQHADISARYEALVPP
jgi:site-specific recombinase XerD